MRRSSRPARLPGITSFSSAPTIPAFIGSALVSPRADMPKVAATAQMARDMREIEVSKGGVTADDLQLLGFTPAQISMFSAEAALQAHRLAGAA